MKATSNPKAGRACPHTAWATLPHTGAVKRLHFAASSQAEALAIAFCLCPQAVAMSVRQDDGPPHDALALLERRAGDRP